MINISFDPVSGDLTALETGVLSRIPFAGKNQVHDREEKPQREGE